MVEVHISYIQHVNYALVHNHIPIFQSLEVKNEDTEHLSDIRLTLRGKYISQQRSPVYPTIEAGSTVRIDDLNLRPQADLLLDLSERIVTSFTIDVHAGEELIHSQEFPLELMAFDQWLGTTILPQCLASFVVPNQPAVGALVVKASQLLKTMSETGSAFVGYQDGDPATVEKQVAAIFAALHAEGLIYRPVPASYEAIGQRIVLADQVLEAKLGNCIELTLLMASALEAVGIHSVLILVEGHAFLGVWLTESCYYHSICEDVAFLEKMCADGINEMLVLECTELTKESASFERAQAVARHRLIDERAFECFIDVHRCRLEGIIALPTRISEGGHWRLSTETTTSHDSCSIELYQRTTYDLDSAYSAQPKETSKFDLWERKLLDFSLRNNLLNLSLGRRALQFISFDLAHFEDNLQEQVEYAIHGLPATVQRVNSGEKLFRSAAYPQLAPLVLDDLERQHFLHSYHSEEDSQQILRLIYRSARTTREETGANPLYLAIGLLRWYEKKNSPTPRHAPILLLPVELVYKRGRYYLRKRDEDMTLNITLIEYLRQIHSLSIPGLDPLPVDEHGVDVGRIFAQIRDALKEQSKWDIEEEAILGIFSFSKFLMWNDIHLHRDKLLQHPVIASLVAGALQWSPQPLKTDLREEDKQLLPEQIALPVPIDSSQLAAVLEAGRGSSFILYGPPGTGKSQTITNLIANALFQGKRVLFVAEKMAALSVVQSRLAKIGLDPFCLELHSNKVTKKHILSQLDKALQAVKIRQPERYAESAHKLFEHRLQLISYLEALHTPKTAAGLSLYDCITRYDSYAGESLPFPLSDTLRSLSRQQLEEVEELLYSQLPTVLSIIGMPLEHPWRETLLSREAIREPARLGLLLERGAKLSQELEQASELLTASFGERIQDELAYLLVGIELLEALQEAPFFNPLLITLVLGEEAEARTRSLTELQQAMSQRDSLRSTLLGQAREELLEADALGLLQEWKAIQGKWFGARFFASRSFLKRMQFFASELTAERIEGLLEDVLSYQRLRSQCEAGEVTQREWLGRALSTENLGALLRFLPELSEALTRFTATVGLPPSEVRQATQALFTEDLPSRCSWASQLSIRWTSYREELTPLLSFSPRAQLQRASQLTARLTELHHHLSQAEKWYTWLQLREQLLAHGLDSVVDELETKRVEAPQLADAFCKGYYQRLAQELIAGDDLLCTFEGELFDQQVRRYKELTEEFQELSKKMLYARLAEQVPHLYADIDSSSEIGRLKRNIASGGRGTSMRQLLDDIPNLLPRLCPCMLMSPMSVAQYIDLDQRKFDLVVFDEASQMPTSEAIGTIARGEALVVVGDPKQMPPTSFFSSSSVDEEDEQIDDLESILQDCQALSLPSLQLNWHYRSRHESLIAFSNQEYYDGKLITFPSVDDQQTKVGHVFVRGVYDKGKTRQNRAEAEAIVSEVSRRLRDPQLRGASIGIVAFSATQQTLIEDLLSEQLEKDHALSQALEEAYEPLFIKNLENVQGDERDVILFSIGYGPDEAGRVSMNFGPLNKVGGERRLNVAVSRARAEMLVFASLQSAQIDLRRTQAAGVAGLKRFLEYAEQQSLLRRPSQQTATTDRLVAEQIASRLRDRSYTVYTQVGSSSFQVNIALADPLDSTRYRLGILLDGDAYRETLTTRDHELVQPSVLAMLDWQVMRLWSVDWFKQPERVLERIVQRMESLPETPPPASTPARTTFSISAEETLTDVPLTQARPYPDITGYTGETPSAFIREVITREQPIRYGLLCKRLASFLGLTRVTSTATNLLDGQLSSYFVQQEGDTKTLWLSEADALSWKGYRSNEDSPVKRSIEEFPQIELQEALLEAITQNVSLPLPMASYHGAKRLGFARRGSLVEAAFVAALDDLVARGRLSLEDGLLRVG